MKHGSEKEDHSVLAQRPAAICFDSLSTSHAGGKNANEELTFVNTE